MSKLKEIGRLVRIKRILHQYYHQKKPIDEIAKNENRSMRTIYRWLRNAECGKSACQIKKPSPCHFRSKFPPALKDRIIELKQENSNRTALHIQNQLKHDKFESIPSLTTIRRYLVNAGLGRVATEYRRGYVAFEREFPNELWQIDIAGVQTIGHLGKLYLFALLDDCSRFIPAAFYAIDQQSGRVIELLQQAITRFGRPLEIVADNGAQFKNILGNLGSKFERILKLMDIEPVFARVRHPQTKGKLERFFGTVKTMFLSEARFKVKQDPNINLQDFNQMFQEWLEFYNTKHKHRGLPNRPDKIEIFRGQQCLFA